MSRGRERIEKGKERGNKKGGKENKTLSPTRESEMTWRIGQLAGCMKRLSVSQSSYL